jgi:ribonuclease HI
MRSSSSSLFSPCKPHFPLSRRATMISAAPASSIEEKTYILHFDGEVDTVTNDAGIGIIIYSYDASNTSKLWSGYCFIRKNEKIEMTKNVADYIAMYDGLRVIQFLSSSYGTTLPRVEIQTSNDIISKHLNGKYRVSSKLLLPWYEIVCKLTKGGNVATVKVDKVEMKLAKQNAMYAVKGRESDKNYKSAMRVILETPQSTTNDDDSDSLSPFSEISSPDDTFSTVESQIGVKSMPDILWEPTNENAELSNAPSISPYKTYILRFDGGSRGNPGTAGSGMVLYDSEDGSEVWNGCQYLGDNFTNNEAEYSGLITGLQCARSLGVENIVAQGDSKLILQQVEGKWKVKAANLQQYCDEAVQLSKEFASFQTCHIERERNARADELANEAMDTKQSRGFHIQ